MNVLQDFKSVKIFVKSTDGIALLGREIFSKFKKLRGEDGVVGLYFTHYPDHVKVGFRYSNWSKVESKINSFLSSINSENIGVVRSIGNFEKTKGDYYLLPKNVISDYIVCQSFDWLLKLENDIPTQERDAQKISDWFLKNKKQIFDEVIGSYKIEFSKQEIFWMLERFIHHLLNAGLYYPLEQWILIYLIGAEFFKK